MEGIFHTRSGIMWPPTTAVPSAPGAPCLCVVVGIPASGACDVSSWQLPCPSQRMLAAWTPKPALGASGHLAQDLTSALPPQPQ